MDHRGDIWNSQRSSSAAVAEIWLLAKNLHWIPSLQGKFVLWGHLAPKWHNRKITTKTKYLRYLRFRDGGRKISELELKMGVCLPPFVKFVFFPPSATALFPTPASWGGHFSDLLPWRVMTRMARPTLTFSMLNGFFYSQSANRDRQGGRQAGRQFGLLSGGHWWKEQRKVHPGGFNTAMTKELLRFFIDCNTRAQPVWRCTDGPTPVTNTCTIQLRLVEERWV